MEYTLKIIHLWNNTMNRMIFILNLTQNQIWLKRFIIDNLTIVFYNGYSIGEMKSIKAE